MRPIRKYYPAFLSYFILATQLQKLLGARDRKSKCACFRPNNPQTRWLEVAITCRHMAHSLNMAARFDVEIAVSILFAL